MPKRIIRALAAEQDDGTPVAQGQEVDLSHDEVERLEAERALVPEGFSSFDEFFDVAHDAYRAARGDQEAAQRMAERGGVAGVAVTPQGASDVGEYISWLREDSPSEADVLAAVGDDPEQAQAMRDAEYAVSGGSPRKGVISHLDKVIAAGAANDAPSDDNE